VRRPGFFLASLVLLQAIAAVAADSPQRESTKPRGEMVLWYRQPGENWLEAMPIGNGIIGAMVFGGIQQERIAPNECTFWSGRPHDYNDPEAIKYFPQIRDLVFAGEFQEAEKRAAVAELLSLQRPDGGWAFASLGDWQRADGQPPDRQTSDGYGTGFAVYVLRTAGLPAQHPQIQKAVAWLKTHQRSSGRWYTRSANKDSKHFLTHEGTAFALMALAECNEVRDGPPAETGGDQKTGAAH
jgi:hypothetical protein